MIPTVDERLKSVIRALTDVILPSLPSENSLAREQAVLSARHLEILREQLDAAPGFEEEEWADARALAANLISICVGTEAHITRARDALKTCLDNTTDPARCREARIAIQASTTALIHAVGSDGHSGARPKLYAAILEHEKRRVLKDREWFAPFGFDRV